MSKTLLVFKNKNMAPAYIAKAIKELELSEYAARDIGVSIMVDSDKPQSIPSALRDLNAVSSILLTGHSSEVNNVMCRNITEHLVNALKALYAASERYGYTFGFDPANIDNLFAGHFKRAIESTKFTILLLCGISLKEYHKGSTMRPTLKESLSVEQCSTQRYYVIAESIMLRYEGQIMESLKEILSNW